MNGMYETFLQNFSRKSEGVTQLLEVQTQMVGKDEGNSKREGNLHVETW